MAAFPSKARMHQISILTIRVCAALALVAATTFFFSRVVPVNAATAGFFYLVAILLIATKGGLVESTIASVAAMLCINFFFLPPVRTLHDCRPAKLDRAFCVSGYIPNGKPSLGTCKTANARGSGQTKRNGEALLPQQISIAYGPESIDGQANGAADRAGV